MLIRQARDWGRRCMVNGLGPRSRKWTGESAKKKVRLFTPSNFFTKTKNVMGWGKMF